MTDREKIDGLLMQLCGDFEWLPQSSIAGRRRYFYDDAEKITKIIDYDTGLIAREYGAIFRKANKKNDL